MAANVDTIPFGNQAETKDHAFNFQLQHLLAAQGLVLLTAAFAILVTERFTAPLLLFALGAASLVSIFSFFESRRKERRLAQAVAIATKIAGGDLTSEIVASGRDDVSRLLGALGDMQAILHEIVAEVRRGTTTVASMGWQIGRDNAALSTRTETQSGALERTASAIEELTATVTQNSSGAQDANQLAMKARDNAVKGGEIMSDVVSTMSVIRQSAAKAVDIIGVIDVLAFQTNILALNAAVEAAHAGAQGRGFAVVAGEVRNLAQRSAAAAKEIKAIIEGSVQSVNAGGGLVDSAGEAMKEIVASATQVADLVQEISDASREQAAGVGSVYESMCQIDEMTQKNAMLVGEAAKTNEILCEKAMVLMHAVSRFNLGDREYGNESDAVEMVQRGCDYIAKFGQAAFLAEVNRTHKGQFVDRDLYLWVARLSDGKLVAHGGNPRQLNTDGHQTRDADGKTFVTDLINTVKSDGEGWVNYKWIHPVTNAVSWKSSFGVCVGDLMIVCGFYRS